MRRFLHNAEILNRGPPNHHSIPSLFFCTEYLNQLLASTQQLLSGGKCTDTTLLKPFIFEDRTAGAYIVTSRYFRPDASRDRLRVNARQHGTWRDM